MYANSLKFNIADLDYSPIKGPAGNIEYIAYMKKDNVYKSLELYNIRKKIKNVTENAKKGLN